MNYETVKLRLAINGQNVTAIKGRTIFDAAAAADSAVTYICADPRANAPSRYEIRAVEIDGKAKATLPYNRTLGSGMIANTGSDSLAREKRAILNKYLPGHNLAPYCYGCPAGMDVAGYIDLTARGEKAGGVKDNAR